MNKLVKDALVLTAITVIAGVCLGGVYEITKKPIADAQEAATQESYKAVFADAASFADLDGFDAAAATKIAADAGYTDDDIPIVLLQKMTQVKISDTLLPLHHMPDMAETLHFPWV